MIVNVIKTKVMVFRQGGRLRQREKWYYDGQLLETVNVFHCVCLLFSTQLYFSRMAEDLVSKGKRALIFILQSSTEYRNLSKTAFFKFFDMKVCPMLLYESELWGLKRFECIEKNHYYACKRFIKVPLKTCNFGLFKRIWQIPVVHRNSEEGIEILDKNITYAKDRYVKKCYNMMLHYDNIGCINWVSNVKKKFYMKMDLDTYGKIKMYKMKMFPTKG